MKLLRAELIIVLLGLATMAQAQFLPQAPGSRVLCMRYSNASGESGITSFHYDRSGRLSRQFWTLSDGSRHSGNFYRYDDRGLAMQKFRTFSDSLTSTERYDYDDHARRTAEHFERSDGLQGAAYFQWSKSGDLLTTRCEKYKGWLDGSITYVRSSDGRVQSAEVSGAAGLAGSISYTYDDRGRLTTETWDFLGRWSQQFSYEYEPIPARVFAASSPFLMENTRFRVVAEEYTFNHEQGGPSTYSYAESGALAEKIFTRSDGVRTRTRFEFDDDGDLLRSHRSYDDGRSAEFTYAFDTAGHLVRKDFTLSTGESGFEKYHYDEYGRLSTATWKNMDFWLSGELSFRRDTRGHLIAGHFTGEDGFHADLAFETDPDGNVTAVEWTFSFGKMQRYEFSYQRI